MWVATVDFMKACDSISHQSLWKALAECGIESPYKSLLRRRSAEQKATVLTDRVSDVFVIKRIPAFCWRSALVLHIAGAASKNDVRLQAEYREGRIEIPPGQDENFQQAKFKQKKRNGDQQHESWDIYMHIESEISWTNNYVSATGNSRDRKSKQASFNSYKQELTSKSYFLQHRLRLFYMVITPTLSYASGTWTPSREHERMVRSTQRKMLRFIVQTKRKYKKENSDQEERERWRRWKSKPQKPRWWSCRGQQFKHWLRPRQWRLHHERHRWRDWHSWNWRGRMDWIHEKKHSYSHWKDESSRNPMWTETHRKMKWCLEMRIASLPDVRWAKKAAEWNRGFRIKHQTWWLVGRPKKEMGRRNKWIPQASGNWRDERQRNKEQRHMDQSGQKSRKMEGNGKWIRNDSSRSICWPCAQQKMSLARPN